MERAWRRGGARSGARAWFADSNQSAWAGLCLAVTLVLLAGCTGSQEPGASSTTTQQSQEPGAGAGTSGALTADGEWDVSTWTSDVTVVPPTFTDAEREQFRTDWLASLAEQMDVEDPPEVPLIRWTYGDLEHGTAVASCLTAAGFPAVADSALGWALREPVPASQAPAFRLATYVCAAQYTLDPVYLRDWTPEQVGIAYDYWVEYYGPCMAAHGYSVSDADKPTREVFVATFFTEQRSRWWPPERLAMLSDESLRTELGAVCPAFPPDAEFYGT